MVLRPKRGSSHNLVFLVIGCLAVLALLSVSLWRLERSTVPGGSSADSREELFVYCAAGIRHPVEAAAKQYEEEFGVSVQLQYGGSNTLLSQLEISKTGDLYLAADNSYLELAREKELADEIIPLASLKPVIVVHRDNPKGIQSIDDLLRPGTKIALGNPDAAAVGKKARRLLTASGHWSKLEDQVTSAGVFKPTVNEVANDVKLKSVDAGIVWDATAAQYDELTGIEVPELDAGEASVGITVLRSSEQPTAALRFARYLGAADRGLQEFTRFGFEVVDGDTWALNPSLTFFAGSVNRKALQDVLAEFAEREGVRINTVYDGCGILTANMKTMKRDQQSGFPDAYMACDVYYLDVVRDWFQDAVNVSDTSIVIVVQRGNPKNIQSLEDLAKPEVRLALGQPEQCTIGVLSRRLLEDAGLYDQLVENNIVTQKANSAMLIPSITTRASDAVLAYESDTIAERDKLEIIHIDSPLAKAVQPFSISRSSGFKQLGRRLYERIANSQSLFEEAGFNWRIADATDSRPAANRSRP